MYNFFGVKKTQIVQFANCTNWYLWKKKCEKRKGEKTHLMLENNQVARMSSQKKKIPTKLPMLQRNKVLNTWDRSNAFNLYDEMVSPFFLKQMIHIHVGSDHPMKVFKQIPNSIKISLSTHSSNEYIFTQNKEDYEISLKIVNIKKNSYIKL